jgi:hypothetical protein
MMAWMVQSRDPYELWPGTRHLASQGRGAGTSPSSRPLLCWECAGRLRLDVSRCGKSIHGLPSVVFAGEHLKMGRGGAVVGSFSRPVTLS